MIFYLALDSDELLQQLNKFKNKDIVYTVSKCDDNGKYKYKFLMKKNVSKLSQVHPFVRNVYHNEVFSK